MRRGERPLKSLPRALLLAFGVLFAVQLGFHESLRSGSPAAYQPLGKPADTRVYRGIAMGSEQLFGYLLAIRLQSHNYQAGRYFAYELMDYDLLAEWLDRVSGVSPGTEYPMLLASRVYTNTTDAARLGRILEYIEAGFDRDPALHWRRLAEASVVAKHKLKDLELALRLAGKLAAQPPEVKMPHWARDLEILLLAELNEFESAIAIIEAMLASGSITDGDEKRFLEWKLSEFQQKLFEYRQSIQN